MSVFTGSVQWEEAGIFYHLPQPQETERKVEQLAEIERHKIARERPAGQQRPHEHEPERGLGNVESHGRHHLPQTLETAVGNDVGIEKRHHRREQPEKARGLGAAVEQHSERAGENEKDRCRAEREEERFPEHFPHAPAHPVDITAANNIGTIFFIICLLELYKCSFYPLNTE